MAIKNNVDYVVTHMKKKELGYEIIEAIDHARMHKWMTLPCKLVRFSGNKVTKEACEVN